MESRLGSKLSNMEYSKLYLLGSSFRQAALQVTCDTINNDLPILYGEVELDSPLVFSYYSGAKAYDLVGTGWASLFLFSQKIVLALEQNGISGWKTYPAKVFDNKAKELTGYSLFSVTGRCGPIDPSKGEIVWKAPPVPEGNPFQVKRGLYFESSSWDGNDIFIPKGSRAIVITEKVKQILTNIKVTNVEMTRLTEEESLVS